MAEPAATEVPAPISEPSSESDAGLEQTLDGRVKLRAKTRLRNTVKDGRQRNFNQRTRAWVMRTFKKMGAKEIEELLKDQDIEGSVKGRHKATWKMRINPGPATRVSPCVVIKTTGNQHPKQDQDLEAEDIAMRAVHDNLQIPVPYTYYGPLDTKSPGYDGYRGQMIVMEDIKGEMFTGNERWTEDQQERFIRQLAVIRIHLLKVTNPTIGSIGRVWKDGEPVGEDGEPVDKAGAMGGFVSYFDGRLRFRSEEIYKQGPYNDTISWILANLKKELAYWTEYDPREAERLGKGITGEQRDAWIGRAATLIGYLENRDNVQREIKDPPRPAGVFRLSHGDLEKGNNIIVRGSKIVGIIDWETARFVPFSEAVSDLRQSKTAREIKDIAANNPPLSKLNLGEYGSDYESDEGMESDGVSMYGHSDEGTYDKEIEEVDMLKVGWYQGYAIASVNLLVYRWFMRHIFVPPMDPKEYGHLVNRNPLTEYACIKPIDPSQPFPVLTRGVVVDLIKEP